jgi:hypothetical protein
MAERFQATVELSFGTRMEDGDQSSPAADLPRAMTVKVFPPDALRKGMGKAAEL